MRRARLVPVVLALTASAFGASAAHAAPGNCTAVQPGRPSCAVQSAGGAFDISCVFATGHCYASADGWTARLESGESIGGTVSYGAVLSVTVYGTAGVATITTTN